MLPLPQLDETRCAREALCVALCPTSCLEMTTTGPWLPRPGDCVSCGVCVVVCPSDAIAMQAYNKADPEELVPRIGL